MYGLVVCTSCGANIGTVSLLFYHCKNKAMAAHNPLTDSVVDMGKILDALQVKNSCCRSLLMGLFLPADISLGLNYVLPDKSPLLGD